MVKFRANRLGATLFVVRHRRHAEPLLGHARDSVLANQPCDPVETDVVGLLDEVRVDARRALGAAAPAVQRLDVNDEPGVLCDPVGHGSAEPGVVARPMHLECGSHPAEDPLSRASSAKMKQ